MAILGLDIGTTLSKCQVFSEDGRILSAAEQAYFIKSNQGERLMDLNAVVAGVKKILHRAVSDSPSQIDTICMTSIGETFVLLDENDLPLADPMLYTDPRGTQEAEFLQKKISFKNLVDISGTGAHAMYSLPKIMWMKKNCPEIFEKARHIMLVADYFGFLMTGERVIDYSLAARTLAFDIENKTWSQTLLNVSGLSSELFSEPMQAGTIIGKLNREFADEIGVGRDCAVVLGGHDQSCAAIGGGNWFSGGCTDGTGTVECLSTVFDRPIKHTEMAKSGYACVPFLIKDKYITYAVNFCAGALIHWYQQKLLESRFDDSAFYEHYEGADRRKPTEIFVLPYFAGAGTPHMDSNATGSIVNLTIETDAADVYRALMEGTAYEMRLNIDHLKKYGISVKELVVSGGGAKSEMWMKIKADIFGVPVYPIEGTEGGIRGCAMIASVARGRMKDYREASEVFVKRGRAVFPDAKNVCRYDFLFERYKEIYRGIKNCL